MATNLLRGNNARAYMNFLVKCKLPFNMFCSNYTIDFRAEGLNEKYVHNMQSNRVFAAFAKLKSNLKDKPVPDVDREKLSYFVHNFKESQYVGDVFNIDLKSAYATVLFRDGYIKEDTFNYLLKCSKQQRLAAVGMLASKKQEFQFKEGKIIAFDEHISPTSNFFFYAVKRTAEIMDNLKQICGNDYLFTWVDGIYYQPSKKVTNLCEQYIKSIGFNYTIDHLRDFEITVSERLIRVNFLKKDKKGKWKKKPFNLPLINTEFKRIIVEAILSQ